MEIWKRDYERQKDLLRSQVFAVRSDKERLRGTMLLLINSSRREMLKLSL